jgi:hypothetical protein
VKDDTVPGMKGMEVARVQLLFDFFYRGKHFPCALVDWFKTYGARPDADTGMWRVCPDLRGQRQRRLQGVDWLGSGSVQVWWVSA